MFLTCLSLLMLTTCLLAGCGKQQTGSAQLNVSWPTGDAIGAQGDTNTLGKTRSITLTVFHNKKTVVTRILNRPPDGSPSRVQLDGAPVNSYTFLATAYLGLDGQGNALGTATGAITITAEQLATLNITTAADPHASLMISPESSTIHADDYLNYTARMINPNGSVVFLPIGSQNWAVDDAQIATIEATTGLAQGHHPGTTTIHLHEAGTDLVANANLTVAAKPVSVFIYTDKSIINPGEEVTLTWQAHNADHVVHSVGFYADQLAGSITLAPTVTTTYAITVTGPGGEAESETIVMVRGSATR
jgi:hypothetical protein